MSIYIENTSIIGSSASAAVKVADGPNLFDTISFADGGIEASLNFSESGDNISPNPNSFQSLQNEMQSSKEIVNDETSLSPTKPKWGKLVDKLIQQVDYDKTPEMCDFVTQEDLKCEQIQVTTYDGYIIQMFRIRKKDKLLGGRPVFIQHGLTSDSTSWVVNGDKSLAVTLARQGYDVFTGNNRGNFYGRKHLVMDPDTNAINFFDYGFYDNAKYDTQAQLEVVNRMTFQKVAYIGHSQGTTQMFAQLSDNTWKISKQVDLFIACAPIVYLENVQIPALYLAGQNWETLYNTLQYVLKIYEINDAYIYQLKEFCAEWESLCDALYSIAYGGSGYHDPKAQKRVDSMKLKSASTKQLLHLGQLIKKAKFIQFDYYFSANNFGHYFQRTPPLIPLENIPNTIPIALLRGDQDTLADKKDVDRLYNELGSKVIMYKEYKDFDHSCFSLCKNMTWTNDVLDLLEKYGGTGVQKLDLY